MSTHGQLTDTGNQKSGALSVCENLRYLKATLEAGDGTVSRAAFLNGAARLGAGYQPVATFSVNAGAGRSDGVAAVRDGAYDQGCSCFRYTSAPHRV
jgi:hypothetical protein